MLNIKKILLPVDFQRPGLSVVHQAATLARRFHSEVILLHAVTPLSYSAGDLPGAYVPASRDDLLAELIRQAERQLERCLKPEVEGLKVERLLRKGDPALEIVKAAREQSGGPRRDAHPWLRAFPAFPARFGDGQGFAR